MVSLSGLTSLIPTLGVSYSQWLTDNFPDVKWWHMQETSGSVIVNTDSALNGTNTAAAIGQPADGNLELSYTFDGLTSLGDIYSVALNAFLDRTKGSLIAFANVSGAGVWTDGINRAIVGIEIDANNLLLLDKGAPNNQLRGVYVAGGTAELVNISTSTTNWFMVTITWEFPGNLIVYFNDAQSGSPQAIANQLVGNLNVNTVNIGARTNTPTLVHDGGISHVGIANRVLLTGEISDIWNRSGLS